MAFKLWGSIVVVFLICTFSSFLQQQGIDGFCNRGKIIVGDKSDTLS